MGTYGPLGGGTFTDDATVGTVSISNPSNVASSDNSYATSILLLSQVSHYCKATNFGFLIPSDATVTGITVTIERSTTVIASLIDNSVKIVKGGTISGNEKATGANWPNSDANAIYGSSTDTWGLTWIPADINASNFGVAISVNASLLAGTGQIDYISIQVDYTGSNRPESTLSHISVGDGMGRNEQAS